MMNLVIILLASLFVECNTYYLLATVRRFGRSASSIFAINHQTPSLPESLTRLPVNNQNAFDYFNNMYFFKNTRRLTSFVEEEKEMKRLTGTLDEFYHSAWKSEKTDEKGPSKALATVTI